MLYLASLHCMHFIVSFIVLKAKEEFFRNRKARVFSTTLKFTQTLLHHI